MSPRSPRSAPPALGIPERQSSSRSRSNERERREHYFLGRYRVVSELGSGGMASVHLGRLDGPGGFQKWVAIKRIHAHLMENDQFVDMFLDEARMAAGINHTNVAHVFDLGKDDDTYWLVMEYLHGEPLREIIRRHEDRRSAVPIAIAARICADAADGLHAAHELRGKDGQLLGLVHRDINPHNLFVTYDGCTKLVDFGIAKATGRLATTDAGQLKGKLAYMAPEQVHNQDLNRTTDIFALGIVLWELTTNQRLFRGDSDLDTLVKVQAGHIPRPSSVVRGYPEDLERIVLRALAPRKEDRFQTARELGRALRAFYSKDGALVDQEDVAAYLRDAFAERITRREAHLTWASEVTGFIDTAPPGADHPGRRSSTPPGHKPARPAAGAGHASSQLAPPPLREEGARDWTAVTAHPLAAPAPAPGAAQSDEDPSRRSEPDDDATLVTSRSSTPPALRTSSVHGRAPMLSPEDSTMVFPLEVEEPRRSPNLLSRPRATNQEGSPARQADRRFEPPGHGAGAAWQDSAGAAWQDSAGPWQDSAAPGRSRSTAITATPSSTPRSVAIAGPPSSAHPARLPESQARAAARRRALVAVLVIAAIGLLGVLALFAALLPRLENF